MTACTACGALFLYFSSEKSAAHQKLSAHFCCIYISECSCEFMKYLNNLQREQEILPLENTAGNQTAQLISEAFLQVVKELLGWHLNHSAPSSSQHLPLPRIVSSNH